MTTNFYSVCGHFVFYLLSLLDRIWGRPPPPSFKNALAFGTRQLQRGLTERKLPPVRRHDSRRQLSVLRANFPRVSSRSETQSGAALARRVVAWRVVAWRGDRAASLHCKGALCHSGGGGGSTEGCEMALARTEREVRVPLIFFPSYYMNPQPCLSNNNNNNNNSSSNYTRCWR